MLISVRKRAKVFVEPFGAILFLGNLCPHKRDPVKCTKGFMEIEEALIHFFKQVLKLFQ
jgi:nitrite reductase/ring-hydroxylating ferredoxin subunit